MKRRHDASGGRSPDPEAKGPVQQARKEAFLKVYNEKWPCLTTSPKGPEFARCTLCKIDFTVPHGGRNDWERHVSSKSHEKLEAAKGNKSIKSLFQAQTTGAGGDMLKVIRAEAMLCGYIAWENIPISQAEKLAVLMKEMFPDSQTAQGWFNIYFFGTYSYY